MPGQATESLDTTGRWAREKHPQRRAIEQGTWVRSGRHGRTGHDATAVIAAGTTGFGWRSGEVWALHLGWSGNHEAFVDALPSGQTVIGAGELLEPGEVVLGPGQTYRTPTAYASYAADGLDGISARFHEWMRARPQHPSSPRPVVLNTWEAVYFAHDLANLSELADVAADVGVERFVLDDGWFGHRRNDRAGLGDWWVDPAVWPDGLGPLIDHVRGLGMQFGLWVEPEMVNEDSDLIREHPDWISRPAGRTPIDWRFQQVLDLVHPEAFEHVLGRLDALLTEYPIAYLKWDQNRDQLELGHDGGASTHAQTLAAYRLLDELKRRHPARRDRVLLLRRRARRPRGAAAHRPRVGLRHERRARAADDPALDAADRAAGARRRARRPDHLPQHRAARTTSTSAPRPRCSATSASSGTSAPRRDEDRGVLRASIELYKAWRDVLHTGRVVRADSPDPSAQLTGVVARDGARAIFSWAPADDERVRDPAARAAAGARPGPLLPRRHRRPRCCAISRSSGERRPGSTSGIVLSGTALAVLGLPMPILNPEHALVLTVEALA